MDGECKLCKKNTTLCNSHIIPEFFYKHVYDEKHRFTQYPNKSEDVKYFQIGHREPLLCSTCENQFSKYERYASQILLHKPQKILKDDDNHMIFEVDYFLMKLFQLSILWRASISNLDGFRDFKLGNHEELLRKMLYEENPGNDYEYGCVPILLFIEKNAEANHFIMSPHKIDSFGFPACRFLYGGIMWIYIISDHNQQYPKKEYFLNSNGSFSILMEKFFNIKFLRDLFSDQNGMEK